MTTAIFPGSFDPITNGHLDVIKQAATVFEKVFVVILTNTNKKSLFTDEERLSLIRDAVKDFDNVQAIVRPSSLTVDVAKELDAKAIIRGIRNTQDFIYEQQIAVLNRELDNQVNTVLFFTKPEVNSISSSMVKEIAKFGGSIEKFLPLKAAEALRKKMNEINE
ncbi:pantetheine-phosphate adenylyltransferase [Lactobacillus agrestimuris]|uniref:pantetheine-phosphate adenylyltransferase n=1 Tax=Lactobacillus agrestimuris TaxID=2941328 RepID=UPI0020431F92|nr:pantetheine-phosphate adenylyltransferase [Lactobacillus agrestimuris]